MRELTDFSDRRHKSWCIHCGGTLSGADTNKDHVPSKSLLREPFPANLPQVIVCIFCNSSFSDSEQYLVAFLGSVLRGTADPNLHPESAAKRILRWSSQLRKSIESARREYQIPGGETRVLWLPDNARIN